jgi:hypothetical protein
MEHSCEICAADRPARKCRAAWRVEVRTEFNGLLGVRVHMVCGKHLHRLLKAKQRAEVSFVVVGVK